LALNSRKAIINPVGIPKAPAMRVDERLTLRETQIIKYTSGSSEIRRRKAEIRLSKRNCIGSDR
jgi:hypothetical protein